MYRISTERHQKALEYALSIIENFFLQQCEKGW